MKGHGKKIDSATKMLNGVTNVYRNIHTTKAQSTIVEHGNDEELDYLCAVDEEDAQLEEAVEEQMNSMQSSEGVLDEDAEDDDDNDDGGKADPCLFLQNLRSLGWDKIEEMKIRETKLNQKERRDRKRRVVKAILKRVGEMKADSVGTIKEKVPATKNPSWRRYGHSLREKFYY